MHATRKAARRRNTNTVYASSRTPVQAQCVANVCVDGICRDGACFKYAGRARLDLGLGLGAGGGRGLRADGVRAPKACGFQAGRPQRMCGALGRC